MIFIIVFFAVLILAGAAFVAWPIWRSHHFRAAAREEERERLLREKRQALRLLRDLEFDYRTGKILEGDYGLDRAEAERRAIELVKALDARDRAREGDDLPLSAGPPGTQRDPGGDIAAPDRAEPAREEPARVDEPDRAAPQAASPATPIVVSLEARDVWP